MRPSSIALGADGGEAIDALEQRRRAERASPAWSSATVAEALRRDRWSASGVDVERPVDEHDAVGVVDAAARRPRPRTARSTSCRARGRPRSGSPSPPSPANGASSRAIVTSFLPARRPRRAARPGRRPRASSGGGEHDVEERTGHADAADLLAGRWRARSAPSPWPPRAAGDDEAEVAHLGELPPLRRRRSRAASCSITRAALLERALAGEEVARRAAQQRLVVGELEFHRRVLRQVRARAWR